MDKVAFIRDEVVRNPGAHERKFKEVFAQRHKEYRDMFEAMNGQKVLNALQKARNKNKNGEGERADAAKAQAIKRVLDDAGYVSSKLDEYAEKCVKSLPFVLNVLLNNSHAMCERFADLYEAFMYDPANKGSRDFQNTIVTGDAGSGKTYSSAVLSVAATYLGFFIVPKKIAPILSYSQALKAVNNEMINIKSATDLTSTYTSGGGQQVQNVLFKFMEKVMILDEAYALVPRSKNDNSKRDSINEIINLLGGPLKDKFFIMALGYPEDMKEFLSTNPGFKRRFPYTVAVEPDVYQFVCTFSHKMCQAGLAPVFHSPEYCDVYKTGACKMNKTNKSFRGWSDDVFRLLEDDIGPKAGTIYKEGVIDGAIKLAEKTQRTVRVMKADMLQPCHVIYSLPSPARDSLAKRYKCPPKEQNNVPRIPREFVTKKVKRRLPNQGATPAVTMLYKSPPPAATPPKANPRQPRSRSSTPQTPKLDNAVKAQMILDAQKLEDAPRSNKSNLWKQMYINVYQTIPGFTPGQSITSAIKYMRQLAGYQPPQPSDAQIMQNIKNLKDALGTFSGMTVLNGKKQQRYPNMKAMLVPDAIQELQNMLGSPKKQTPLKKKDVLKALKSSDAVKRLDMKRLVAERFDFINMRQPYDRIIKRLEQEPF